MKIKLDITGLDCPNCAAKLAKMIEAEEGIESAKINFLTEKLIMEASIAEDEAIAVARRVAKAFSGDVKIG